MHYHNICINLNKVSTYHMVPKQNHAVIIILPPSNINGMTFSHNQHLYLSCVTTPLGKIPPALHRPTSNNFNRSTKSWVRALLLSSC